MRALTAAALLGLLLLSCQGRSGKPAGVAAPQAPAAGQRWFTLREGKLEETEKPGGGAEDSGAENGAGAAGGRFAPWTVQERVADLLAWRDRLWLAVNGYGLAFLPAAGPAKPNYLYDPPLFGHRTVTCLLPRGEELLCHLYFNALLNTTRAEDLKVQGISLLSLSPADGTFRPVPLPFQTGHPEWEAVGFLAEGDGRYLFEWKLSERQRTQFRYTAYNPLTRQEWEVERAEYLQAWHFQRIDAPDLSPALRALLDAARRMLAPAGDGATALQFLLRAGSSPGTLRYEYRPDGFATAEAASLVEVPLFRAGGIYHALLPDGTLLSTRRLGTGIRRVQLPALPAGYRYTGLLVHGGRLLASWEQRRFYEVGSAGLLLRDSPW